MCFSWNCFLGHLIVISSCLSPPFTSLYFSFLPSPTHPVSLFLSLSLSLSLCYTLWPYLSLSLSLSFSIYLSLSTSISFTFYYFLIGIAALISCPAEVTLVRISNDQTLPAEMRRNYKGVGDAFSRILKEEGRMCFFYIEFTVKYDIFFPKCIFWKNEMFCSHLYFILFWNFFYLLHYNLWKEPFIFSDFIFLSLPLDFLNLTFFHSFSYSDSLLSIFSALSIFSILHFFNLFVSFFHFNPLTFFFLGAKTFFSGSGPLVNRAMLVGAVQVGTYDQFREMFRGMGVTSQFSNVFSASMVSGEMQRQICQMERLTNVHAFMYACHIYFYISMYVFMFVHVYKSMHGEILLRNISLS